MGTKAIRTVPPQRCYIRLFERTRPGQLPLPTASHSFPTSGIQPTNDFSMKMVHSCFDSILPKDVRFLLDQHRFIAKTLANPPFYFQSLPRCFSRNHLPCMLLHRCRGGMAGSHFPFSLFHFPSPLSPLQCAVTRFRAVTPLECALMKTAPRKSFRMRSSKKSQGGGVLSGPYATGSSDVPGGRASRGSRAARPSAVPGWT